MPIYISSSCELISSKSMLSSFSSSYKFFFFINIFFINIKKFYLFLFFYVSITFSLSFLLSFTNVKVKYLVCSTNFIRKKKKKKKNSWTYYFIGLNQAAQYFVLKTSLETFWTQIRPKFSPTKRNNKPKCLCIVQYIQFTWYKMIHTIHIYVLYDS